MSFDLIGELLSEAAALHARMRARNAEQANDQQLLDAIFRRLDSLRASTAAPTMFSVGTNHFAWQPSLPATGHAMVHLSDLHVANLGAQVSASVAAAKARLSRVTVPEPAPQAEPQSKYEVILGLIASNEFDVGLAARAIYGDDGERSRNKVHAGVAHLREQGRVVRLEDGSLRLAGRQKIRSGVPPVENGRGR